MWNEHKIDITKKTSNSYEVKADDILRAASAAAKQPSAYLPDSQFLQLRVRYHLELQKSVKDAFARIRLSLCRQELIKKDGGVSGAESSAAFHEL